MAQPNSKGGRFVRFTFIHQMKAGLSTIRGKGL
jgi:hypothetical protein